MELTYLIYAFSLGLIVGSGLFCLGLSIGRLQAGGGVKSFFKKEKIIALEDIPGTDAYYEKARLSPEDGGHDTPFDHDVAELSNRFEDDLIELARHSE
jgi:hypothetical protein